MSSTAAIDDSLFKISFKEGLDIEELPDKHLRISKGGNLHTISKLSPAVSHSILLLKENAFSKNELAEIVFEKEGYGGLSQYINHIEQLERADYIRYTLFADDTVFCIYEDMMQAVHFANNDAEYATFRLSKFACIRTEDNYFLLESSLSNAKIKLYDIRLLSLIGCMAEFKSCNHLYSTEILHQPITEAFIAALHTGRFLEYESDNKTREASELWSFHDLLFHTRTRYGKHNNSLGGTYRFIGKRPPKTAIRNADNALQQIVLTIPSQEALSQSKSLYDCMESRKSCRTFNGFNLEQLSTLLYRCLRIKGTTQYEVHGKDNQSASLEVLSAPYPSGGGLYELNCYITISQCEGLEPGFYFSHAFEHTLSFLQTRNKDTDAMMWYARACIASAETPPVLITLAADFERMFWKYENMAYAAILKNVGVIFQTLYLVATDMNIGACAIGNGNIELFRNLNRKTILQESSVGEFILGSNH